ncbi:MAG: TonB-dependent receptor [Bacteroidetes bacterium]|nr:TonB-dependent receptor [Bacteroidota bacterium]
MRKLTTLACLFVFFILCSFSLSAQTVVSGSVKNSKSKESVAAVSVTVKGGTTGTYTDDKGIFKFTTSQKPPFTLVVSSVGYKTKEVTFTGSDLNVSIDVAYELGDEVVVAASRVAERILESPVSIERVSSAAIKNTPATNYYDMLANLKGVDVTTSGFAFKTISTRGFNSSGNLRLNQIVDGMDNQAPGLNFAVGSVIGLTELDVDNMELLSGASSALYGSGGMNGTLLINSKSPFKYQGLSFQVKEGVNNVDGYQRPLNLYSDWALRWGKKVSEKFAFKIGAEYMQAKEWLANNQGNYARPVPPATGAPFGSVTSGDRNSDPNYDGINVYGDETTQNLSNVNSSIQAAIKAAVGVPTYTAIYGASQAYLGANPGATIANYNTFLNGIGGGALVGAGYSTFLYGGIKNYYTGQNVSRTGYLERDVIDPNTVNVKLQGGLYYKLSSSVEASLTGFWGMGNTVYTGSDRYSLKNLKMGQYKLEVKGKDWFVRAWMTKENAGDSYNVTIASRYFNEAWKPSTTWYPTYMTAYTNYIAAGLPSTAAHQQARAIADAGRPTGPIYDNPLFQKIIQTPISQGGALFLDKTSLYVLEGQWNLTNALKLPRGTELLVGGNWKRYWLDSQGTLFADKTSINPGKIKIDDQGAYAQLSQKMFNDVLKVSVSGRYDKSTNFDGRFTPRASAVVKLAQDHNIRLSYQQAYRFPSTQNQWIGLVVGGGTVLSGGIQQMINYYGLNTNPVFSATGSVLTFNPLKPETASSYEVGYKGLFGKKFLIDVYAYMASYDNFITSVNGLQVGFNPVLGRSNTAFSVSQNANGTVKTSGWGASVDYLLPNNFMVGANIYGDKITDQPSDPNFVSYFNTPKTRVNLSFGNTGFLYQKRIGFNIVYKWQESFWYEGSFAVGNVPAFGTIDAQATYKFPEIKSQIKFGATNLFNKYYINGFGNAQVGGLYYVAFGYNIF